MKDSNNGIGGIGAIILGILGILLLKGVIGPTTGLLGVLFRYAGIACVVCGVGVLLLVIAAVIAAILSSKPDPNMETKAAVNKSIADRRQQIAKLKSSISVLEMDRGRVRVKIAEADKQIELCVQNAKRFLESGNEAGAREQLTKKQNLLKSKENLMSTEEGYNQSISQMQELVANLESETSDMELRRNNANAKIRMAEAKQSANNYQTEVSGNNQESLGELEKQAQFQADYIEAIEKLKKQQFSGDLPTDKYDISDSETVSAVDEELQSLKSEEGIH